MSTTTQKSRRATQEDINDVSAWAEIIGDVLCHVPDDLRENVLNLAVTRQQELKKREEENGGILLYTAAEFLKDGWMNAPGIRSWHTIMRLKALLIQVFVRNITNNHSPDDAAELLFSRQRFGTGSGVLLDYIGDLPRED